MSSFKKEVVSLLSEAAEVPPEQIASRLEYPPDESFGDLAFPCHLLSNRMKKLPQAIASELAKRLLPKASIDRIAANGPYLNFFADPAALATEVISSIVSQAEAYGLSDEGRGKTIVIDFSSPNIAKPFGVGHLRTTVLGNALYHIFSKLGYRVVRVNHLGDWGTQFGKLITAFKLWGDEVRLEKDPIGELFDLYVEFHRRAESDSGLEEKARQEFKKLEEGEQETLKLWRRFRELSLQDFDRIYRLLGIQFDSYAGESFYNPYLEKTIEALKSAGLTRVSEDALIIDLEKYGMPPCLLKKKDEATLYATRDIAAAIYRYQTYKFHKNLYVVGSAQRLHFQQVFKVLELMGHPWSKDCHHVELGWIKFEKGAMSTRKGNIVFLEDVLARSEQLVKGIIEEKNPGLKNRDQVARQVGIGAVVFWDLSARRNKDINFSWEQALNFEGQTGPYLQYTYARLASVLRRYGEPPPAHPDLSLLSGAQEKRAIKLLCRFPEHLQRAAQDYEPYHLVSYLLELSSAFNSFYQSQRILCEDLGLRSARVSLAAATRAVLQEGLRLLGMEAPQSM
jgi:arginyl-tRNA synthetase